MRVRGEGRANGRRRGNGQASAATARSADLARAPRSYYYAHAPRGADMVPKTYGGEVRRR